MKQGWEIKKIGEVVQKIFAGGDKPHMFSEQQTDICCVPVYGNGVTNDGLCGYTDHCVVNERCLTVSARGTVGYCCVRNEPFVPIVRLITIIPQESIGVEFLCYALSTIDIENNGVAIPQLTVPMIKNVSIPVPPIAEQEKIVAELDCLSGIIEKKKQQLKELDNLAQSIFYEMFGDPVENDRGWEEKKLGDVCSLKAGKAIKANELSDVASDNLYPCFGGNGIRGYIEKVSHHNQYPIIGRQGALCGNVVLSTKEFYATEHAVVVQPVVEMNIYWSYYTLMYMNLNRLAQGVAQPGLSVGRVNQENFILPPLALQQEFASKVEAIEKQKELIKQSIQETETLFNSRMDYYFN